MSRSPVTIDILSVIDCERIIADGRSGGDVNNPTFLGSNQESDKYVHMVCSSIYADPRKDGQVWTGEGHSELEIKANVGDTIQWSITCLHEGTSYNTSLQAIEPLINEDAITEPRPVTLPINMYVAPPFQTNPTRISFTNYVIDSRVVKAGVQVTYRVVFQMFDRVGVSLGFFSWDPFISITNN